MHLITGDTESPATAQLRTAAPPRNRGADTPVGSRTTRAPGAIVGSSPALLAACGTAGRVAVSRASVVIEGESGTGKELLARFIHERSPGCGGPLVTINCATVPEHLVESDLFGHEAGAFTGAATRRIGRIERANGGTLFLDEIGDMSLPVQAKLLRVLQEREIERLGGNAPIRVDVRVIAATNRHLEREVAEGRFREDLYYRLSVIVIRLPPLRDRGEDIRLLAEEFLRAAAGDRHPPCRLSDAAMTLLLASSWPGNIRQLRNAIESAVLFCEGGEILPAHLPPEIRDRSSTAGSEDASEYHGVLPLHELERTHIRRALARTDGHLTHTAEILGIHRNTLRRKLESYALLPEQAAS